MDKNKNFDHLDCKYPINIFFLFSIHRVFFLLLALNSTVNNHAILSNTNEEDDLEKEIEHLERRLTSAKSQLTFVTSQKNKQSKT